MKYSTFATIIFFGSVVSSPHRHLHQHAARHPQQEQVQESPVSWVTEVVVKTVQVTTTVWVTPFAEPTPTLVEPPAVEESVSTPNTPAQFFETQLYTDKDTPTEVDSRKTDDPPPSSELQPSMEKDISSSKIVSVKINEPIQPSEPQSSSENDTPSSEIAAEKIDHPIDDTSSKDQPTETTFLPQGSPVENYEVPKPASSEIKAPEPSIPSDLITASSQISTEAMLGSNITAIEEHATAATCSPSSPCDGDITYYDPGVGYGACGWKNTKNEPVVALPHEFMGSRSNGNQYCGKTITIMRDGKKSTARVVDKCMGCTGYSIDLSDAVFSQLASLSVGRTSAKWWVN